MPDNPADLAQQLSQLAGIVRQLVQAQSSPALPSVIKSSRSPFNFEEFKSSGDESISDYFDRFETELGLCEIPETEWSGYLRVRMGSELSNTLRDLVYPAKPSDKTFAEITSTLKNHYEKSKNK